MGIDFYKSNTDDFNDPYFKFEFFDAISTDELQALADNGDYQMEPAPQSLNLIAGEDKRLYLIGAVNTKLTAPIIDGTNRMWLWEIRFPESPRENLTLIPRAKADKNLHSYGDGTDVPYRSEAQPACQFSIYRKRYRQGHI